MSPPRAGRTRCLTDPQWLEHEKLWGMTDLDKKLNCTELRYKMRRKIDCWKNTAASKKRIESSAADATGRRSDVNQTYLTSRRTPRTEAALSSGLSRMGYWFNPRDVTRHPWSGVFSASAMFGTRAGGRGLVETRFCAPATILHTTTARTGVLANTIDKAQNYIPLCINVRAVNCTVNLALIRVILETNQNRATFITFK